MCASETTGNCKSQFIKVNHYRSKLGLQHGAFAHTAQQAIESLFQNVEVKIYYFIKFCRKIIKL